MPLMYDSATPPTTFGREPWGGYLPSQPHGFATWPVAKLKEAMRAGGVVPIHGAPQTAEAWKAADAKLEAAAAVRQVKLLDGDLIVVAVDVEESAYAAAPKASVDYLERFADVVWRAGGLTVAYGCRPFLADLWNQCARYELGIYPWLADYTNPGRWPVPGWPSPRGWQYAGNVNHNGHVVDLTTFEQGWPIIGDAAKRTQLSHVAHFAAHTLKGHLSQRNHPISSGEDRQLLAEVINQASRALALHPAATS